MASYTKKRRLSVETEDCILLYDRRKAKGDSPEIDLSLENLNNFEKFKARIQEVIGLSSTDKYIITTVNREEINDDKTYATHVQENGTIYVLDDVQQELQAPTKVRVEYQPHYDTLIKSGMYEYYASEGKQPLPFAIAELVDNSLGATSNNIGSREIELRLLFDESQGKNAFCVIDNGRGMTTKQLNNWAVYRLSKFLRNEEDDNGLNSLDIAIPRSLNSDISYFGVGGKHAVFYMGNSCRMITKPKKSKDVHELLMSKEGFETKEKSKEDIYKGFISNRKPGYNSHLTAEDENICRIISEEVGKESFTCVVVTIIKPEHVQFLKANFKNWCRQLAHIFHYYLHGPQGNLSSDCKDNSPSIFTNINITVKMFLNRVPPKIINLRAIEDDLQTQYIRTASSNFEFKAIVEGTGVVEGLLYYHPFLYDRETFPLDPNDLRGISEPEDDHDYAANDVRPARGKRDIFECFWNGRLIPYTTIAEFDWCAVPKRSKVIPIECYNRISGILWTNDKFQVSTNKLTFSDLEVRLKDKNTVFTRMISGHEKRANIDKQFTDWLKECHENFDKQIEFLGFKGIITRLDLPKNRQNPWSQFERIKWDNKIFEIGQLVRILRTTPITFGTVKRFLLYGEHEGDVFATGGDVEIMQEPRSLYDEVKIVPIAKLDRTVTPTSIKKFVDEEEGKFPDRLIITWPEGDQLIPNEKRPAGKTIGAIKVEIVNKRGDLINKLPGNSSKKLLVELKIIWHSPTGDETIVSHIGQHAKNWAYWFRKMENIKNVGAHTLQFQVLISENNSTSFGGCDLPCLKLKFIVTEAEPDKFTVGLLDGPFRIGAPFQIPLEFQDGFNHQTKPNTKLKPILEASGLELSYDGVQIKGSHLLIKGIVAKGSVSTNSGKNFNLTVKIPGLGSDSQTLKIRLHPGPPHKLVVKPEAVTVFTENGSPISFDVEVLDISGNITAEPKLNVICKFTGSDGLPVYTLDCSNTGQGILVGSGLRIKKFKDTHTLKAVISLQNYRDISSVEKIVQILPSTRAALLELVYHMDSGITARIEHEQELQWTAGEYIRGLTFKLYDEANREISIEANLVSKLKVNWTPKLNKETVMKGLLPDVKVPNGIVETKYCHISLNDGLEFSFTIKPTAGEPSHLKCTLTGNNQARLGELLPSDVLVAIADKYGNVIKKLPGSAVKALEISGDGVLVSEIEKALGQSSGFVLRHIKFSPNSPLGPKELCVKWNNLVDYVRLIIVAGPPTQLHLPKWPLEQPLTIFNEGKLDFPLVVQLCDIAGNPSPEANVKVQLCPDSRLKLTPAPQTTKTDSHGKVNFGIFTVNAPSGTYEIYAKAIHGRVTITSSVSQLCIQPDVNKPIKISVEPSTNISLRVADELPVFKVSVLAETDQPILSAQASHFKMKLWKMESQTKNSNLYQFNVDNKQSERGLFTFSNKKMPEVAGSYNASFAYDDGKYTMSSKVVSLTALPGPPLKLEPIQVPSTPTVSNGQKIASRYLIRSLKLELRDAYDNPTGANLSGKIVLQILGDGSGEVPQLEGGNSILEVQLSKGKALLQNILLEENTGGKDGVDYRLRCTVELNNNKSKFISPYDIPFLFYNDAKKQREMSELSKERDSLVATIKTYRSLFATTSQLISELRVSVQAAAQEEQKLKLDLRKQVSASQLNSVDSIENVIKQKLHDKDKLLNSTRRKCTLPPTSHDSEILGKIGHLAQVIDADVARVLSWHMKGDMDCIVTYNATKAMELYHASNGSQQVLALETIFKKNVPEWNKPLPHSRVKNSSWKPSGNPVYVRQLLIFPHDPDNCKTVFGALLGDTILLDTLEDACAYRQEVVKYTYCPSLLTRQGSCMRSNGKFGGNQNQAPLLEQLRGAVFGEPLPVSYQNLCSLIASLQSLQQIMMKHSQAKTDLKEHQETEKTPQMLEKIQECQEAEDQLHEIEQRLGMTPSSPTRGRMTTRGAQYVLPPELSKNASKRSRTSSSASSVSSVTSSPALNGTGRTSGKLRSISASPASDDRKRRRT